MLGVCTLIAKKKKPYSIYPSWIVSCWFFILLWMDQYQQRRKDWKRGNGLILNEVHVGCWLHCHQFVMQGHPPVGWYYDVKKSKAYNCIYVLVLNIVVEDLLIILSSQIKNTICNLAQVLVIIKPIGLVILCYLHPLWLDTDASMGLKTLLCLSL